MKRILLDTSVYGELVKESNVVNTIRDELRDISKEARIEGRKVLPHEEDVKSPVLISRIPRARFLSASESLVEDPSRVLHFHEQEQLFFCHLDGHNVHDCQPYVFSRSPAFQESCTSSFQKQESASFIHFYALYSDELKRFYILSFEADLYGFSDSFKYFGNGFSLRIATGDIGNLGYINTVIVLFYQNCELHSISFPLAFQMVQKFKEMITHD